MKIFLVTFYPAFHAHGREGPSLCQVHPSEPLKSIYAHGVIHMRKTHFHWFRQMSLGQLHPRATVTSKETRSCCSPSAHIQRGTDSSNSLRTKYKLATLAMVPREEHIVLRQWTPKEGRVLLEAWKEAGKGHRARGQPS
jgi:hypothetical protein